MDTVKNFILSPTGRLVVALAVWGVVALIQKLPWVRNGVQTTLAKQLLAFGTGLTVAAVTLVGGGDLLEVLSAGFIAWLAGSGIHDNLKALRQQLDARASAELDQLAQQLRQQLPTNPEGADTPLPPPTDQK